MMIRHQKICGFSLILGVVFSCAAQAEFDSSRYYNFIDTETGLEWRKVLPVNVHQESGYSTTFDQFDADTTYRFPTSTEMDDLFAKTFPNFVSNDVDGFCADANLAGGGYPELEAEVETFLTLFGHGDPAFSRLRALYEDASGTLRGVYIQRRTPFGGRYQACLTSGSYESFRIIAPYLPADIKTFVVRPALDRNAQSLVLFNDLHPDEVGFTPETLFFGSLASEYDGATDQGWASPGFLDYTGTYVRGEFELKVTRQEYALGRLAPWVRVNSMEYTGPCTSADTDIGGGWCRRSFPTAEYEFTGEPVDLTATYVDNEGKVDNIRIDQIRENIVVDFYPADEENDILIKHPGWTTYIEIETTSTANGDDFDFDASTVDPASIKIGPGLAQIRFELATDTDGDGDTDYIYGFGIGDSGVTCLDSHITLAARTSGGAPIAGVDFINPIGCEENVEIDVDPFNSTNIIRPDDDYNVTVAIMGMRVVDGDAVDLYPERESNSNLAYSADGVDRATLRLGAAETPLVGSPIVLDINSDNHDDLLVSFNVFDAGIACTDTELELVGEKNSGIPIEGVDTIVTEGCTTSSCHP
jgi:hypothetical protein